MSLIFEKVLILKNVPLFADVPEGVLSDIIIGGQEISAVEGTDIVKEGNKWNDLYILLQGQVKEHKNGQDIREFNAPASFGELAALDAETAPAAFTAQEDSVLLKLSGEALYRLINEHKSLEKSLFKTLCRRLRQQN